jgi:hypothetical protein
MNDGEMKSGQLSSITMLRQRARQHIERAQ